MRPALARAVFVDFETNIDGDFTLTKMSTRKYVTDPRLRVLCVTIAAGSGKIGFYYRNAEEPRDGLDAARDRLSQLAADGFTFVSHNVGFDGLVTALHWRIHYTHYFDTLGYARFLGLQGTLENVAAFFGFRKAAPPPFTEESLRDAAQRRQMAIYCATDTALARVVFEHALGYDGHPEIEFAVNDSTASLNLRGLHVDRARAGELARRLGALRAATLASLATEFAFDTSDLNKNDQVRRFVADRWNIALTSLDKRNPELIAAMATQGDAARFLTLRGRVQAVGKVIERLGARAGIDGEVIYNFLHYYGAHTGRFSAGGRDAERVNVHTLFKSDNASGLAELAEERSILVPPPECLFRAGDLSQIEARVVAWLTQESALLERFAADEDVYAWFVGQIFPGVTIVKNGPNNHLRDLGKESVLGLGFGMGFDKFLARVRAKLPGIDADLVRKVFDAYQSMFPRIRRLRYELFRRFGDAVSRRLSSTEGAIGMHASLEPSVTSPTVVIALPTGRWLHYRSVLDEVEAGPFGPRPNFWYAPEARAISTASGGKLPKRRHIAQSKLFPDGQVRARLIPSTLIENVVQAIARDVMVHQALALEAAGIDIAFHTHDEIVGVCAACNCGSSSDHRQGCSWLEAGRTIHAIMSAVPATLPALTDLPLACELNPRVGKTYG